MELNSALYDCHVWHQRKTPKQHAFSYRVYMFWLDLAELPELNKSLRWFSRNKRNLFSFFDTDHLKNPNWGLQSIQEKLFRYLGDQGIHDMPSQVCLLTQVRVFGYVFNPVSFYYCYNEAGDCVYVVAEVSNTFGEMKMFLITGKDKEGFRQEAEKYFYVSPFTLLDDKFHFTFQMPGDAIKVAIQVSRDEQIYFHSTLSGQRRLLSDRNMFGYFFRLPLVTLKIISAIHWQAFLLWTKGLRYQKKKNNPHLQRDIINIQAVNHDKEPGKEKHP